MCVTSVNTTTSKTHQIKVHYIRTAMNEDKVWKKSARGSICQWTTDHCFHVVRSSSNYSWEWKKLDDNYSHKILATRVNSV
jgi:hypothetical protein